MLQYRIILIIIALSLNLMCAAMEEEEITIIEENGALLIVGDAKIDELLSFGIEDKTLVFQGGKIVRGSKYDTICGDNTRIVAPLCQIFDDDVEVDGVWAVDRAYPQWFGAVAYSSVEEAEKGLNADAAINKAIKFKKAGEVFIPRGVYLIKNTVKMPAGIQLVGEVGYRLEGDDCGTTLLVKFDGANYKLYANSDTLSNNNYALAVNVNADGSAWEYQYPATGTLVKNITFENETRVKDMVLEDGDYKEKEVLVALRCCLCYGGSTFDTVIWRNFGQAVYFPKYYSDHKAVVDCTFNCAGYLNYDGINGGDKFYAFDMGWLGDALLFRHNQINDGDYTKGLRISSCGGGVVSANVINADVLIENSKGITYSSNHMEYGAKLFIKQSNVTTSNNYFWRGVDPSVIIWGSQWNDGSVVTMNGDMFLFYNSKYYKPYEEKGIIKDEFLDKAVCEYDVAIDGSTVLNLSNVYRYEAGTAFEKMYMFGIKLAHYEEDHSEELDGIRPENKLIDKGAVDEFNRYSYALSQNCSIHAGFCIDSRFSVNYPTTPATFSFMKNGNVRWVKDTNANPGLYSYSMQVYWDKDRRILYEKNGESDFVLFSESELIELGRTEKKETGEEYVPGALISFNGFPVQSGAYIRLIRTKHNSGSDEVEVEYVDVPVSGSAILYDNGLSVAGFGWQKTTITSEDAAKIACNSGIIGATFTGKNMTCYSTNKDVTGAGWAKGDMIVNVGADDDWTIEIIK